MVLKQCAKLVAKWIIDTFIRFICIIIHSIHQLTGNTKILLLEFNFLAFCGSNVQNIAIIIICGAYAINLIIRFISDEMKSVSTAFLAMFMTIWIWKFAQTYRHIPVGHMYTFIRYDQPFTILVQTLINIVQDIADFTCNAIQFVLTEWWNIYYLYHSKLLSNLSVFCSLVISDGC